MANPLVLANAVNVALGAYLLCLGILASGIPRRGPTRWLLAAYLALVGINYANGGLNVLLEGWRLPVWRAHHALNVLTAVLDPPALLLFALAVTGVRLRPWAALAFAPSVALAAWGLLDPVAPFESRAWIVVLSALLLACYLGAFAVLARRWMREPGAEPWAMLVTAFGVICLTRVPLLYVDLQRLVAPLIHEPIGPAIRRSAWSFVMEAGLAASFGAFALLARRGVREEAWPQARRVVLAVGGLLLALDAEWLLRFSRYTEGASHPLLYSMRWFLFLAVITAGLRRHEIVGIPAAVTPWLRRMFTGLLLAIAAVIAAILIGSFSRVTEPAALAAGAAAVGLLALVALALRVGAPGRPSELEWRRDAVYRAHLALGSAPDELDRVRRQLGLSEAEARRVEALVEMERGVPASVLPERVEPGQLLLGRYRVERVLGAGAFGRAYAATDALEGARVVLKELLPSWQDHPEALARFRREAETALRVRHPNLVEFRSVERLASGHVLVLGYVEGETLAQRLARGPLREPEAGRLARDLLAGLAALHRHGVVHRDVKPENVVVQPGGRAVLMDFGAVTGRGGATQIALGAHPGTPGYASPEQERGEPLTPASDVYAVARLLWRALSGADPPAGDVPAAWRGPLTRALDARPEQRPADAEAMLAAVPRG